MHSSALAAMQARSVCSWPIVHAEELFQTRNTCGNIIFKNQGKEGRQHVWQEKWMIISISVLCGRESQRSPALFLPIFSLVFPPFLSILQSCSRAEPTQALIGDLLGLLPCYFCAILWDYKVLSPVSYHSISTKSDDVNIVIILQVK